jgi:hypothetical protein
MSCDKMLLLTFLTLSFVRGETPAKSEGEGGSDHDPWRDSNQPKIFADYLRKPLSGNALKCFYSCSPRSIFVKVIFKNFYIFGNYGACYKIGALNFSNGKLSNDKMSKIKVVERQNVEDKSCRTTKCRR